MDARWRTETLPANQVWALDIRGEPLPLSPWGRKLPLMTSPAVAVRFDDVIRAAPQLMRSVEHAAEFVVQIATTPRARRQAVQTRAEILKALDTFRSAVESAEQTYRTESQLRDVENAALRLRVKMLEQAVDGLQRDLEEWQREYEPDSLPRSPFFSNIRQFARVLFSAR